MITFPAVRNDHLSTARRYAGNSESWPVTPRFNAAERWYRRLAAEPDVEVWLLTWLPGQGTELHDHGGSAGAFVVVSGELTERTVALAPGTEKPRLVGRALGRGAGRSFGAHHVHQITNLGDQPAISVHVYGPALRTMTRYRIEGERLLVAAVDLAGVQW